MPLVIDSLGGGHTHRQTHIPTREQKRFQETRRVQPSAAHAWFKNFVQADQRVKMCFISYQAMFGCEEWVSRIHGKQKRKIILLNTIGYGVPVFFLTL